VDKPPKTKKPPTEPVEKRKRTLAATLTSLQRRAKNSCARLSSGPTTVTVELELDGDAGKITATATGSHSITGLGRCVTGAISKSNYGPFETPGPEPITLDITFE
ncbi:MAG: hypothetical protein KC636_16745, partial [Myxococcales bacterium]|nr:hypothetical protein [Myxococcales bacterium]